VLKSYGRLFAYLAVVSLHCYSEDNIRRNVQRAIGAFKNIYIPKYKRVNRRKIFIITTLTLIAIYVSL
jgi:hypothetical protein